MSSAKEMSTDLPPTFFVRGSKMRKSFRIRQRYSSKLPPAAKIFMMTLEQNKVGKFDTLKTKFIVNKTKVEESEEMSLNESFDPLVGEEEELIRKAPVLRYRESFKKLKSKKKVKLNSIINFFLR